MKKILFIFLISYSLFFCEYGNENLDDQYRYDLDSTVCMYCRINTDIFYGTSFASISYFPDSMSKRGAIIANFLLEKMQLTLNSSMMLSQPNTKRLSTLKIDSLDYLLSTNEPFDLNFTTLSDTLIIGNFFGKFINVEKITDTLNISDGFFRIHPHIWHDFFLSLYLNNNYLQTNTGAEKLDRNIHSVHVTDTTFQDSLSAEMDLKIETFSNDFIQEFKIDPNQGIIVVSFEIKSKNSVIPTFYSGYSGLIKVNALDYIIQRGVLQERLGNFTFEIEAMNNNYEILQITDGNFSSTGF